MKKLIQQVRTFILSIIMDRILYCIIYKTESALKVFDKHVYCLPHFLLCLSDCLVCQIGVCRIVPKKLDKTQKPN